MDRTIEFYRRNSVAYPVGNNIKENLPIITAMADTIISLGKKNLCLCCMGSSGAIISGIIASLLPADYLCCIAHVKKEGEESHQKRFTIPDDSYVVIVDDFVATGETICNIYAKIQKFYPNTKVDCLCVDHMYFEPKIDFKYETLIIGTYEKK